MTRYSTAQPPRPLFVAEPPAVWHLRQPVVVDCSLLAALLWGEAEAQPAAEALLGKALHAPQLLAYELANVARNKARSGADADASMACLQAFAELRVVLHPQAADSVQELAALAQRYALTAYDAAYLMLAGQLQAPLLSFDQRLAEAAARHLSA